MAARQIMLPYAMPAQDLNGRALSSKLYFYAPGATLNTPKTVYTEQSLTTAHAFPIVSDMAGRFPPIWADEDEYYDVVWTDSQGATQRVFDNARGLSDALAASALASQASADAAALSEAAAAASETAAAVSAAAALSDADRAEAAAADAEQIAGFDVSEYVWAGGAQSMTDTQKAQARSNIAATSHADLWFHARR